MHKIWKNKTSTICRNCCSRALCGVVPSPASRSLVLGGYPKKGENVVIYQWIQMDTVGYPLVMTNSLLWKDPPFFMGKSTISMAIFHCYVSSPEGTPKYVIQIIYPLVMTNKKLWKITMLLMGKSTISTGPFSIAMLNYQRVPIMRMFYKSKSISKMSSVLVLENA